MRQSNVRSGFRHEQSDIEFHAAERQFVFHRIIKNKKSLEGLTIKYVKGDKGSYHLRFSGIRPLRGGGTPLFR